jgi:hypothetical protein
MVVDGPVSFTAHLYDLYHMSIFHLSKHVAIDTSGGKRNLKMKIKAQQMTFRQDITKYKMYWLTFRIVHNMSKHASS